MLREIVACLTVYSGYLFSSWVSLAAIKGDADMQRVGIVKAYHLADVRSHQILAPHWSIIQYKTQGCKTPRFVLQITAPHFTLLSLRSGIVNKSLVSSRNPSQRTPRTRIFTSTF